METEEQTPSAFLDIATNLLAILLILTLFALAAPRQFTEGASQLPARPSTGLRFVAPQRERFPPFSRFYVVLADRVTVWDQEAVVAALAAAPHTHSGTTRQGRFDWQPEWLVTRDIDGFQLRFWFDRDALLSQSTPWGVEQTERLVDELAQDAARNRIAPVFIVYPDGLETFVPIYERLQARGQRFRWFTQRPDEPLLIGRHVAQFTHYSLYW
ncbi:hypothetical protein E6P07_04750 [Thermochromatium tepidum ATCC 43061]|uniref:Uncharacterized protein n=2 Tax=Thermochromatium tepidum TaxID=1050 RepID=A0A6I6EFB9_THETI|nr:hypothetical protein E6P07_04750 [Thermochromatium tepidum ATCC 43061]